MRERLLHIVRNEKLSNLQFANEIGISPAAVTHILSGRNNPSLDIVAKIAIRYPKYNLRWLILGEGNIMDLENPEKDIRNNSAPDDRLGSDLDTISADHGSPLTLTNPQQSHTKQQGEEIPQASASIQSGANSASQAQQTQQSTRLIVCFPDNTFVEYIGRK